MRFYYDIVMPLESMLATQNPRAIWRQRIAPTLDAYTGLIFEDMVEQAFYRLAEPLGLPLVREWGRWEGVDRHRQPLEVDIASLLSDGRVLTGAIKWNQRPVDVDVHTSHLGMLDRLADAGLGWAHKARQPNAPLIYVAAGGFTDSFRQVAQAARGEVHLWTIDDVYRPL